MNADKIHGCGMPYSWHIYDRGAAICPEADTECPDCGPTSYCLACGDDRAYTRISDERRTT